MNEILNSGLPITTKVLTKHKVWCEAGKVYDGLLLASSSGVPITVRNIQVTPAPVELLTVVLADGRFIDVPTNYMIPVVIDTTQVDDNLQLLYQFDEQHKTYSNISYHTCVYGLPVTWISALELMRRRAFDSEKGLWIPGHCSVANGRYIAYSCRNLPINSMTNSPKEIGREIGAHILEPDVYLHDIYALSMHNQRVALMTGIFREASVGTHDNDFTLMVTSQLLAYQIIQILWSFGLRCSFRKYIETRNKGAELVRSQFQLKFNGSALKYLLTENPQYTELSKHIDSSNDGCLQIVNITASVKKEPLVIFDQGNSTALCVAEYFIPMSFISACSERIMYRCTKTKNVKNTKKAAKDKSQKFFEKMDVKAVPFSEAE